MDSCADVCGPFLASSRHLCLASPTEVFHSSLARFLTAGSCCSSSSSSYFSVAWHAHHEMVHCASSRWCLALCGQLLGDTCGAWAGHRTSGQLCWRERLARYMPNWRRLLKLLQDERRLFMDTVRAHSNSSPVETRSASPRKSRSTSRSAFSRFRKV